MIVFTVEQRAAQMEGPEGQLGIFATRVAAEQYRDDLLRLDPHAHPDFEAADESAGMDNYVLVIEEVEIAQSAPTLVASYDVSVHTAHDVRSLYQGTDLFKGRQPTESDIEDLLSIHRPLWHVEINTADKVKHYDGVQVCDSGSYYEVQGNDLDQVKTTVHSLQDLVRQIISEELLPTTFGPIDDLMESLDSVLKGQRPDTAG